nr:hypothetical protein BaRGS_017282 [Batillaria attramentaria]
MRSDQDPDGFLRGFLKNDLLAHLNTKIFLIDCGARETLCEAIHHHCIFFDDDDDDDDDDVDDDDDDDNDDDDDDDGD